MMNSSRALQIRKFQRYFDQKQEEKEEQLPENSTPGSRSVVFPASLSLSAPKQGALVFWYLAMDSTKADTRAQRFGPDPLNRIRVYGFATR